MSLFERASDYARCSACTHCTECGVKWCRDDRPGPGEETGLCPDCFEKGEWTVHRSPGWQQLESPEQKVRYALADLRQSVSVALSFVSARRDHVPPAVLESLAKALHHVTEAGEAMPPAEGIHQHFGEPT